MICCFSPPEGLDACSFVSGSILDNIHVCVSFMQPQQQNANLSINSLGSLAPQTAMCSTPPPPVTTTVVPNLQHMAQPSTAVSAGNQATTTHIPHPPSSLCSSPNSSQSLSHLPQLEPPMQTQLPLSEQAQHQATLVRIVPGFQQSSQGLLS